jgi:hypothetical protein
MRSLSALGAAALLAAAPAAAFATVVVPGTDDIFLASQPDGSSVSGYFGSDVAPDNSPALIAVGGGQVLTFSASGSTSVDGSCFAGADGGCYGDESGFSPPPASNTYKGPADALVGVFLASGVTDVSSGLKSLNYTRPAAVSRASYKPALNQIFFIGDGLTGTGSGAVQKFVAPAGAAGLYLAAADSIGASTGNLGSLSVDYAILPAGPVPEPDGWALLLIGFLGLGVTTRSARRRQAPVV